MNGDRPSPVEPVPLDESQRHTIGKRVVGLTEFERQLLLKELAEIQAELDELKQRTAEITARFADASSARLDRPA